MASIRSICGLVEGFVSSDLQVSEFANSFVPIFKSALKSANPEIQDLALKVHAQISHYFNSLISEEELASNLKSVIDPYGMILNRSIVSIVYSVSAASIPSEIPQAFVLDEDGELVPA